MTHWTLEALAKYAVRGANPSAAGHSLITPRCEGAGSANLPTPSVDGQVIGGGSLSWHPAKAGTGDWRLTPNVMDVLVERFGP